MLFEQSHTHTHACTHTCMHVHTCTQHTLTYEWFKETIVVCLDTMVSSIF